MNIKRKKVCWRWLSILAGTITVAVVSNTGAQATESAMEKSFAKSCLAAYRNELAGWQATRLDEEGYRRAVLSARASAADSCSAFVERMEGDGQLSAQESTYLRDARDLLADTPRGQCIEARVVSEVVRSAQSLFRLAACHFPNEKSIALLREAVEIAPGHLGSLLLLTNTNAELDLQARAEYGEALYERSKYSFDKTSAAKAIVEWAVETGDIAAAQAIHERLKRDLLNEPPLRRCVNHLDVLGLEEVCLEALESVAADALAAGEALPDRLVSLVKSAFWQTHWLTDLPSKVSSEAEVAEMLATPGARAQLAENYANSPKHLEIMGDQVKLTTMLRGHPDEVKRIDHDTFLTDALGLEPWELRRSKQARRLKAVLENHPKPLRTSEHYLALAATPSTWRERIALLRGALEVEPGHVGARCDLARALEVTGDLAGARKAYRELLAYDDGSCRAQARLDDLDNRAPTEAISLDDLHGIVIVTQ